MHCQVQEHQDGDNGQPADRRGWAEQPQRIAQREKDAAGIAAAADYERLTAPRESLLEFFRNSPLAEAMAEGELDLERERDPTPDIIW